MGFKCSWRLDSSSIWVVSFHFKAGFQETGWMRKLMPAAPLPVGSSLSSLSRSPSLWGLVRFPAPSLLLRRCSCFVPRFACCPVACGSLFWMSLLRSFYLSRFSLRILVSFSVGFCFFLQFSAGALCVVTVASLWKSQIL